MLYLNRVSACVVGASESLKGAGCGEKIDAHDHIIRVNAHPTEGFEKDTGSKSTIMCHAAVPNKKQYSAWHKASDIVEYWHYQSRLRMISETLSLICMHEKYFPKHSLSYMLKHWPNLIIHVFGLPPWSAYTKPKVKTKFNCEIEYIKQQPPLSNIVLSVKPSTGMMAVMTAIYRGWNVSIVGFGKQNKSRAVKRLKSYDRKRSSRLRSTTIHNFEEERLLLNDLESKKLLKRLDN